MSLLNEMSPDLNDEFPLADYSLTSKEGAFRAVLNKECLERVGAFLVIPTAGGGEASWLLAFSGWMPCHEKHGPAPNGGNVLMETCCPTIHWI